MQPTLTFPQRIAAAVDHRSEGQDAAALGAALARAAGADLMLVAVHPDPIFVLPSQMSWSTIEAETHDRLARTREELAPQARVVVETDLSTARGLTRVVRRDHRDLLVVGSGRSAEPGHARIGKRTRQLLDSEHAIAIAARGLHEREPVAIASIGVGFDGEAESAHALEVAAALASACGASLHVCSVVDDRIPAPVLLPPTTVVLTGWDDAVAEQVEALEDKLSAATQRIGVAIETEVTRGRPADALLELSGEVDLLVLGSRRWGAVARLLFGSTGEALARDARCSLLFVPKPA